MLLGIELIVLNKVVDFLTNDMATADTLAMADTMVLTLHFTRPKMHIRFT